MFQYKCACVTEEGRVPDPTSGQLVAVYFLEPPQVYIRLHDITSQKMVKLSLYRSLGLQEVEAPKISRHSAHEGGKVVSPTQLLPLPPGP